MIPHARICLDQNKLYLKIKMMLLPTPGVPDLARKRRRLRTVLKLNFDITSLCIKSADDIFGKH